MTQLTDYTRTFFRRKYNVMVERLRIRLHRRKQEARESVHEYFTALKQIAANCRFEPNEYGSRLRDVSGVRDESMPQKFYEKEDLLTQTL